MDFGLKELGITFMIGAFTILGFELVLYNIFKISLTGFYKDKLGLGGSSSDGTDSLQTMRIAVFVGLAFGVGVLAEDLSYKYVDKVESSSINWLPMSLRSRLPSELQNMSSDRSTLDSRIGVLFGSLYQDPGFGAGSIPEPNKLARDLADNGALEYSDTKNGGTVQNWIRSGPSCRPGHEGCPVTYKMVADSVESLYYDAKNRVYLKDAYYDELKRIEARRDFSRSIALISFLYIAFSILCTFAAFSIWMYGDNKDYCKKLFRRRERASPSTDPAAGDAPAAPPEPTFNFNRELWRSRVLRPCSTIGILALIWFFSVWAFERELDEFHKRVYGYYSTIVKEEKKPSNGTQTPHRPETETAR